ncbi:TPA: acyltransferase [Aeromonas salmonicida]|nr:acyltransferase [Aeromonas salmonicida]
MNELTYDNVQVTGRAYENRLVISDNFKTRGLKINFAGTNASVEIGINANIQGTLTLNNNAHIFIDENFSNTNSLTIISRENCNVTIGKDCMFATAVLIRTSDEHSIIDLTTNETININKDVLIGDHVWLCDNALILKGSNIGNGSIVGARSVVTGKYPPNVLLVGSPVKVVKKNVSWEKKHPKKTI